MRVAVLPSDTTACGTYRLAWPAEVVANLYPDWEVILCHPDEVSLQATEDGNVAASRGIPPLKNLDLLVVQRVGSPAVYNLMRWAQMEGCAVVMDNDDAMWAIDIDNAAWRSWNASRRNHWSWTDKAAGLADVCTVTTPMLARRYGGARAEVLPNCIPQSVMDLPVSEKVDQPVQVGWPGYVQTHPRDLLSPGKAVREAQALAHFQVIAIPDNKGVAAAWGLPANQVLSFGPYALGRDYYLGLQNLDIALVPLADNAFNRGKSYLKALECAAMGAVVVATPTPANRELAKTVPILLADTPSEWREHLVRLVRDPNERADRVARGQQSIRDRHTVETNAHRWAAAWERAVTRRRRLTGAR